MQRQIVPGTTTDTKLVRQDKDTWTPQNELEESIVVIGYGTKKDSTQITYDYSSIQTKKKPSTAMSYDKVEKKPVFKESVKDYQKFIAHRIIYPVDAMNNRITGKVVVAYVIDKDGNVTDVQWVMNSVTRSIPIDMDGYVTSVPNVLSDEVERVIKSFPAWEPGSHNGKNVAVQCYAYVEFRLVE